MGSTDPELPRPGSRRRVNLLFRSNHTGPHGSRRARALDASEERGEANAGDDIKTPNTAAGPSGSRESPRTGRFDLRLPTPA
jgi:hypothetical protein